MRIDKSILPILNDFKRSPNGLYERALIKSVWDVEHYRRGVLIDRTRDENTVTAQGINQLIRTMFTGGTQIILANWYVLIFKTDTTPADGTTYATPVFTEETEYDNANRPAWQGVAGGSKSATNSANKATFVFNSTSDGNTMYGGALVGGSGGDTDTKGDAADATGRMYSAAKFSSSKLVEDDDTLKVTITLTGADA